MDEIDLLFVDLLERFHLFVHRATEPRCAEGWGREDHHDRPAGGDRILDLHIVHVVRRSAGVDQLDVGDIFLREVVTLFRGHTRDQDAGLRGHIEAHRGGALGTVLQFSLHQQSPTASVVESNRRVVPNATFVLPAMGVRLAVRVGFGSGRPDTRRAGGGIDREYRLRVGGITQVVEGRFRLRAALWVVFLIGDAEDEVVLADEEIGPGDDDVDLIALVRRNVLSGVTGGWESGRFRAA